MTHTIVIAGIDEHDPNFTRTGEKMCSAAEFEKIGSYRDTNDRSGKVSTVNVGQKFRAGSPMSWTSVPATTRATLTRRGQSGLSY